MRSSALARAALIPRRARGSFPLGPRREGTIFDGGVSGAHVLADRIPVETFTAPTLVINSAHAQLAPPPDAGRFVARLTDARLLDIDHGGHVLVGNISHLRAAIADFLST